MPRPRPPVEFLAARGKAAPMHGGIKIAANLRRRARQRGDGRMRDRVFVRRLRSLCRRSLIGLAALSLLAFSGCESTRPPLPPGKPGLHVVVRPGPSTWFTLPDGTTTGFDHDLLTRFARERGVPLNVTFADGAAPLLDEIARGDAQLGAGGLLQAADVARRPQGAWQGVGVEHRLPLGRARADLQRRRLSSAPMGGSRSRDRCLSGAYGPRRVRSRRSGTRILK